MVTKVKKIQKHPSQERQFAGWVPAIRKGLSGEERRGRCAYGV